MIHSFAACIILTTTSTFIFVLFIVILQQTCVLDAANLQKWQRFVFVAFYTFLNVMQNIFKWLCYLYPQFVFVWNINICAAERIYEFIMIMYGLGLFRQFELWLVHLIYNSVNMYPPKWFKIYLIFRQIFASIFGICCYSLSVINHSTFKFDAVQFVYIFYMFLGVIVVIESAFIVRELMKIFRLIEDIINNQANNSTEMRAAKSGIKLAIYLAIICVLMGIGITVLCAEPIWHLISMKYDETFIDSIAHSIIIIIFTVILTLWVYQKNKCCIIPADSVCVIYACGEACAYYCVCCCESDIAYFMDKFDEASAEPNTNLLDSSGLTVTTLTEHGTITIGSVNYAGSEQDSKTLVAK
eukprot:352695_1